MHSFGYDNIVITRRLSNADVEILYSNMPELWQVAGTYYWRPERCWIQRTRKGELLVNINAPKFLWGYNVQLASFHDLNRIYDILELETGLCFRDADVRSVHVAVTWESNISSEELGVMLKERKGFKKERYLNTTYLNAANKQLILAAYDKLKHLKDKAKRGLLNSLTFAEALPKIELRLESKVRKQLKAKGLWTHHSLRARDLATPEFFGSIASFFIQRVESFLAPSPEVSISDESLALLEIHRKSPKVFKRVLGSTKVGSRIQELAGAVREREVHGQVRKAIRQARVHVSPSD